MYRETRAESPYLNAGPFASHYLDERVSDRDEWSCDEDATAAFERLRSVWDATRGPAGTDGGDGRPDSWVDAVVDALGFDTLPATGLPDGGDVDARLLFGSETTRREAVSEEGDCRTETASDSASALLVSTRRGASFGDRRGEDRSSAAARRLERSLERTPGRLRWGVLTDGRTWRLYGTGAHERGTYYEVDLPELLESANAEAFKYFYVFFRSEAFEAPAGTTFLDSVRDESEAAVDRLADDLRDRATTALGVLGEGFAATNDLDVAPDEDGALDELKAQSLVVLARLLFVFHAASRDLVVPDDPARDTESEDRFGTNRLRLDVVETVRDEGFDAYDPDSTSLWRRLMDLFSLVDAGGESSGVSRYDAGLFGADDHAFLSENAVADRYLAEVVYRLSTAATEDGVVAVDYADFDARHLGAVYEELLAREFRVADGDRRRSDAGREPPADAAETDAACGLSVVVDDGERKATGAYYTPEYVVTHVVRETVGPLVEEIESDLGDRGLERGTSEYVSRFADEVLDLNVLDPAMGCGHFLTAAADYLAERVTDRVRELATPTTFDERRIRREIAEECLYGVDVDGTAVELAKLSVWLETSAPDRPPAALDRHLSVGNSLVGADVSDRLGEGASALSGDVDWGVGPSATGETEGAGNPRRRLVAMADVDTAERFGVDVPDDASERVAEAVGDDEAWASVAESDWFAAARRAAEAESFFHWELAFPEVFFDPEGDRRADAGFDAVVGNPPWVATAGRSDVSANMDRSLRSYLERRYDATDGQFDLYVAFCERFVDLSRRSAVGIVVPDAVLTREQNAPLRRLLLRRTRLRSVLSLGAAFDGVENGAAVLITGPPVDAVRCADVSERSSLSSVEYTRVPQRVFDRQDAARFLLHLDERTRSVLSKVESYPALGGRIRISRGEEMGKRADRLSTAPEPGREQILPGGAVTRYGFDENAVRYVSASDVEKSRDGYRSPKLILRQTCDSLVGALDTESRVTIKSAYNVHAGSFDRAARLLGVLNSTLLNYYHDRTRAAYRSVFPQINQSTVRSLPVPRLDGATELTDLVERQRAQVESRRALNLDLSDHLGAYSTGRALGDVGRPVSGAADASFRQTTRDRERLEITDVALERESPNALTVGVGVRYKPDSPGAFETDANGYRYVAPEPAFRVTDLAETEADLIAAFVPHAVAEAGGYANFRRNATKTISPLDRLRGLTLPRVDDVRDGLASHADAVERAAELDAKIDRTDERIDELVYELYGLTDEEVEIVESATA